MQQKYRPKKIFERKKKIEEFIIDEILIKIGSELMLWLAIIGFESKQILGIS
jgi:putative transposase